MKLPYCSIRPVRIHRYVLDSFHRFEHHSHCLSHRSWRHCRCLVIPHSYFGLGRPHKMRKRCCSKRPRHIPVALAGMIHHFDRHSRYLRHYNRHHYRFEVMAHSCFELDPEYTKTPRYYNKHQCHIHQLPVDSAHRFDHHSPDQVSHSQHHCR